MDRAWVIPPWIIHAMFTRGDSLICPKSQAAQREYQQGDALVHQSLLTTHRQAATVWLTRLALVSRRRSAGAGQTQQAALDPLQ